MNREIMKKTGFAKEVEKVDRGICPICSNPVTDFRDKLSEKEYFISGMCQDCQDKMFGA